MSMALRQCETRACKASLYQLVSYSRSQEGMHALVSHWRRAIDVDGDYVEK
jgi:hypothetical protein